IVAGSENRCHRRGPAQDESGLVTGLRTPVTPDRRRDVPAAPKETVLPAQRALRRIGPVLRASDEVHALMAQIQQMIRGKLGHTFLIHRESGTALAARATN